MQHRQIEISYVKLKNENFHYFFKKYNSAFVIFNVENRENPSIFGCIQLWFHEKSRKNETLVKRHRAYIKLKWTIPCAVRFLELRSSRGAGHSHGGWVNMARGRGGRPIRLHANVAHVAEVISITWGHLLSGKSISGQRVEGCLLLRLLGLLLLLLHLMLATGWTARCCGCTGIRWCDWTWSWAESTCAWA